MFSSFVELDLEPRTVGATQFAAPATIHNACSNIQTPVAYIASVVATRRLKVRRGDFKWRYPTPFFGISSSRNVSSRMHVIVRRLCSHVFFLGCNSFASCLAGVNVVKVSIQLK